MFDSCLVYRPPYQARLALFSDMMTVIPFSELITAGAILVLLQSFG